MRSVLLLIFFGFCAFLSNAQLIPQRTWTTPTPLIEVNDYIFGHFEIGGGGHVFIVVPGGHAKLRYAPINYQRIKLMGEVRGEIVTAPIVAWNYNFQLGTGFDNGVGIHAGLGRSHYVSRRRISPTEFETVNRYQNTLEFGMRWEGRRRQYDIWTSIPLYIHDIPIFTVGISFTAGGMWNFDRQKWFLPQRK